MKKRLSRIMACFMACVIAFNVIAIPKAKASAAVVGTSALATSALASYMTATGVPLTVISGGAAAASAGTASLVSGYAAATGATYEVVTTAIAAGTAISGGTIILGAAAVAVLAGIVAWAINEYDLIDENGAPVTEPVSIYTGDLGVFDGVVIPALPGWNMSSYPYAWLFFDPNSNCIELTAFSSKPYMNDELTTAYIGSARYQSFRLVDGAWVDRGTGSVSSSANWPINLYTFYWANFDLISSAGEVYLEAGKNAGSLSASLDVDYSPKPELAPETQVRIETGVSPELAPEAVPDAIFESIAANEFAPTYAEEPVADAEPDTGGDSGADSETNPDASEDTGLLRRIAIACEALADKILGGIESLFAPDPALMQEISEAFTDKFGFVSTLHQLGSDLLAIDATSAPPVVYIHLEDAEGSIYYGETVKALDMSWYARYKPDVDRIMSGFLWLGFLWLLFKRASAIIQGAEMATDYGVDVHDGYRIRGERNGKRF